MSTAARIEELRKKFEENPRRFFAPLANELRKAGDLTQAIALCREHLPKQPGHMSGYIVFGQALFESGELDEGRVVFEQALALDPENLIALHHLGHIARQVGDTASARRWYERALETDPRNDDIALQLAALATPIRPMVAVPTPAAPLAIPAADSAATTGAADLEMLDFGAIPSRKDLGAIATPPYPQNAVNDLPLAPTPDAAMRAVDFDQVNASLRNPASSAFFDLEAIESVGNAMGDEASADPSAAADVEAFDTNEPIDISFDEPAVPVGAELDAIPVVEAEPEPPLVDLSAELPGDDEDLIPTSSPEIVVADALREAPTGQAMADDPFGFEDEQPAGPTDRLGVQDVPAEAVSADELAVEFEEGLVTANWPDTTEFTVRQPTPRMVTPLNVDVTPDAVEAFGREPQDPVVAPMPAPEPEILGEDADLVAAPLAEQPSVGWPTPASVLQFLDVDSPDMTPDVPADIPGDDTAESVSLEGFSEAEVLAEDLVVVTAADEVDDVVSAADPREELPWLAASDTPADDVAAIVQALEDDARALGESDDVQVDEIGESEDDASVEAAPAFVTETMGELLVAQGFLERAVVVYEELVRRRPYDPVLSARLAELQALGVEAAPVSMYTARERFAALAARRVSRRTPARAATPIASATVTPLGTPSLTPVRTPAVPTAARSATPAHGTVTDSLSALFGSAPDTPDDDAAQALADAFAPLQVEAGSVVDQFSSSFFGESVTPREPTPAYGALRQPTPARVPSVPTPQVAPQSVASAGTPMTSPAVGGAADFSFDRFFPDPAASARETPAAGTTPVNGPADADPSTRTSDDLAQFSAWLKGLGNA